MKNRNSIRNTKELYAILSSIYCINTTGSRDNDINNIVEYAFSRVLGGSTNLLLIGCVGRSKEQVMPEVMQILNQDTQYPKFLKENKRLNKFKPNTIYNVLVDWANESGYSEVKSYLFSTLEKAKEQLRKEALKELGTHRGDDIFCDEECNETFIKQLLNEFNNNFKHMDKKEHAAFIINAKPDYYHCYLLDSESHYTIRILEQIIDAPEETAKEEE